MTVTTIIAVWGAIVSSGLAAIKLWEVFWKDRLRLATSYMLTGERGGEHEIVVANISPLPVQIASWKLAWEPKLFRFNKPEIDVSPDWEDIGRFKIDAHSSYVLKFGGLNQFSWDYKTSAGRRLTLRLKIFGLRREKVLRIT
ncbi:hypothetical protein ACIQT7_18210 [Agrobacterium deltaense]